MEITLETFLKFVEQNVLELYFITVFSSLFFALILYISSTAGIGRWIRLLGWFFSTFVIMYGLKILVITFEIEDRNILLFVSIITQILSISNSFLMLLAAKELLSGEARTEYERSEFFLFSFINQIRTFIPRRIKLLALVALIFSILPLFIAQNSLNWLIEFLVRLPDAFFSAYCFVYLGFALWINIAFLHRRWVAIVSFIPNIYYALAQIFYLLNPLFLSDVELFHWDRIIFVITLPLKFAIFLTAYYLGFKILEVFREITNTIDLVANTRKDFLSRTGILESIGKVLKAESISLFIRTPSKTDPTITLMRWTHKSDNKKDNEEFPPKLKNFPEIEKIFRKGRLKNYKMDWKVLYEFLTKRKPKVISTYIPLLFNGAVIGCLVIELNKFAANTNVVTHQIERFASRLSTSVHDYREGLSLQQATHRCATHQFENVVNGSQAVDKITQTIYDILSPEGIRIKGGIGFKQKDYTCALDEEKVKFLRTLSTKGYRSHADDDIHESLTPQQNKELENKRLLLRDAPLKLTFGESRPFGKLFLLVKSEKDDINSPTLGVYPMHRRAIATIISDSLVDLARNYLNRSLTKLDVELSQEPISVNKWFQSIAETAKSVELLWAVATNPDSKNDFFGEEKNIRTVKEFWNRVSENNGKNLFSTPIGKEETAHIITLHLMDTEQMLWFGVKNPTFGFELEFNSPWKLFLEHLAEIADAVLFKIQAQQKQVENTSYHALATMATTTGTIVHQLVNMAQGNEAAFSAIYKAISRDKLGAKGISDEETNRKNKLYKDLINGLKSSGEQMIELTEAFREITKFSEERPCNLLKASNKAKDLFNATLAQNDISTKIDVDPQITLDIPFHIATLTLANLFSNSKDALKGYQISDRKIRINAREVDSSIVCSFIDNGPGIPEHVKEEIFELGKSTKIGGSGWGLYLVKRALRENGSWIELKSSDPGHTEFVITFPKAINNKN